MAVKTLALTGNILMALSDDTIAAWQLTEEGMVDVTGEVLARGVLGCVWLNPDYWHRSWGGLFDVDHLHKCRWDAPSKDGEPLSWNTLGEGWVKDLEGNHLLWLPVEWRNPKLIASWSYDSTVVWLDLYLCRGGTFRNVIIEF
ncbi:hypothetical protein BDM02DRAFT_3194404 [Thelephora ganbajun]|uniref:Uncharacterized protein n=1 Tax=Thelephora ganbajun TaxID=370292 RepID=A0ACB6YX28_THEGA|nr:hypothetical protein BDM02DRAFT_3194404 [Thelephora ganbajun]